MKTECRFKISKITQGALQYKQTHQDNMPVGPSADNSLIGTIYLRKAQVQGEPKEILVTVVVPE